MQFMLIPLVSDVRDPVGSMGNDSALACLTDQPRMLYDYFKQLFAQVTNPAIDSIREDVIMSLMCYIGPEGNLLNPTEANCHRLLIDHPILTNRGALCDSADSHREMAYAVDRHHLRSKIGLRRHAASTRSDLRGGRGCD